jgi:ABC-type glycerol-3-phosphate transport system substrate-binding protein
MDIGAMPKNRLILIAVIVVAVLSLIVFFWFHFQQSAGVAPVTITVWGTDKKDGFDALSAAYAALRPKVTVKYVQVGAENYDATLLNAFATGQGPDVFMIGNHDVVRKAYLLAPAPVALSGQATLGLFPAAVGQDMIVGGSLYALPLYMDDLAMVYNRALLDQAGIPTPPSTWRELLDDIPRLRKLNAQGQLIQPAAVLGGTSATVPHAADLISLLMLQNGVTMNTPDGRASFSSDTHAEPAFRFYLDFANPSSAAYAWDQSQGDGVESFLQGKTAILFAYREDLASFRARSPFLNFTVAPMLQVSKDSAINYPSYQGLAVWKQSKVSVWAWDFIAFASTNPAASGAYLTATKRAPALRSLTLAATTNPDTGIFASQALTGKTWYIPDYAKMDASFDTAINSVTKGAQAPQDALSVAEDQINNISR